MTYNTLVDIIVSQIAELANRPLTDLRYLPPPTACHNHLRTRGALIGAILGARLRIAHDYELAPPNPEQ